MAQVRRLIVGFAADRRTREGIRRIWEERGFDVLNLIAVWAGPGRVVVACKVKTREQPESAAALVRALNDGEAAVRAAHPEVAFSFVEPDTEA